MTISLSAEYILSYVFLKKKNILLLTQSSIFYITTKKHFPFALFAPNYLLKTLIFLTLFWYAKSVVTFLVWFSQHRIQTKILSLRQRSIYALKSFMSDLLQLSLCEEETDRKNCFFFLCGFDSGLQKNHHFLKLVSQATLTNKWKNSLYGISEFILANKYEIIIYISRACLYFQRTSKAVWKMYMYYMQNVDTREKHKCLHLAMNRSAVFKHCSYFTWSVHKDPGKWNTARKLKSTLYQKTVLALH